MGLLVKHTSLKLRHDGDEIRLHYDLDKEFRPPQERNLRL